MGNNVRRYHFYFPFAFETAAWTRSCVMGLSLALPPSILMSPCVFFPWINYSLFAANESGFFFGKSYTIVRVVVLYFFGMECSKWTLVFYSWPYTISIFPAMLSLVLFFGNSYTIVRVLLLFLSSADGSTLTSLILAWP
jgi:hypothetical protein